MNLMEATKNITITLDERIRFEEEREPCSYGVTYDRWDERMQDLVELKDLSEELKNKIDTFQIIYGGLKRLQVK